MTNYRSEQISERVREIVSTYINRETSGKSLITVTAVDVNEKADRATIFITVLPEKEEGVALEFLKRKRTEIRKYIMKNLPVGRIPFIEVQIDKGQKLADKITELSIKEKSQE